MTYPTQLPKPSKTLRYAPFKKHLGFYCKKCDASKRLDMTHLCECLVLEEDPRAIRGHMESEWVAIYADVPLRP